MIIVSDSPASRESRENELTRLTLKRLQADGICALWCYVYVSPLYVQQDKVCRFYKTKETEKAYILCCSHCFSRLFIILSASVSHTYTNIRAHTTGTQPYPTVQFSVVSLLVYTTSYIIILIQSILISIITHFDLDHIHSYKNAHFRHLVCQGLLTTIKDRSIADLFRQPYL